MILTGSEIRKAVRNGSITLTPFDDRQVNPNSYDFRLGDTLLVYDSDVLDPAVDNPHHAERIPPEGFVLFPNRLYLGSTVEVIGSNEHVPIIRARSSIARLGLFVHITADLIDLGSVGQLTLQMHAVQPVRVYPRLIIGQVTFWRTYGERTLYRGKYQGSQGPVASKSYQDWRDAAETEL